MNSDNIKTFERYNDIRIHEIRFVHLDEVWDITVSYSDTKNGKDDLERRYVMDAGVDVVWERFTREIRKQREDERVIKLYREDDWVHIDISGDGNGSGDTFLQKLKESGINYTYIKGDDYMFEWGIELFADPAVVPFIEGMIGEKYSKYESVNSYRILEKEE